MSRSTPRGGLLLLLLGGLTCLLGIGAALAPVDVDDPVVSWPRAGEAPASTVLPLSPYRPLQFTATVPCAAAAEVSAAGGGDVLRTMPASADPAQAPALAVTASGGTLRVVSAGDELYAGPVGEGCSWSYTAGADGTVLARDGVPVAERPELAPPQVAELSTTASGPAAEGLSVQLHTDARYESSPSPLKVALLVAHVLALAATLAAAVRVWTSRSRPAPAMRFRLSIADAVVVVVSAAWAVLGPVNIDDSWYALMARQGAETGMIGNAIYQFNVTEAPFTTSQYLLQFWGQAGEALGLGGWSLVWLRVVPVLLGLITWFLLRATLLVLTEPAAGGTDGGRPVARIGSRPVVVGALAAAHLAWFLAYGIALRPEPAGTAATAGVLLLVAVALRTRSVGPLAPATALAVVAVTTAPTALVAAAPLLLALPLVWRRLVESGWTQRLAMVAVAFAAASVVVPLGLADATLADLRESFAVHRWYYYQYSWFAEAVHYTNLLGPDDQGAWGKRLPVLLTVAVLLLGLVTLGRTRGTGGPLGRALGYALATTALGLVAVAISPTKWVNHFGAVAAPATLLLALALSRGPLPRGVTGRVVAVGTAVLGVTASVVYAGPNLWRPLSDWGQLFGGHTVIDTPLFSNLLAPHAGPLYLRNPLLWLAVAVAALGWAYRRCRRPGGARTPAPGPDRAVLGVATAGGVALMLVVFTAAPVLQAPGASVASMNLAAFAGRPCGLADAVTVQVPARAGPPVGAPVTAGDMQQGTPPQRDAPPGGGPAWHTDVPGGTGTGSVTTAWSPVPADASSVLVPATGDVRGDQSVVVELGTGPVGAPAATARVEPELPEDKQAEWTELTADPAAADLPGPLTQARVVVEDRIDGPDTWLGVGAPRPARAERAADVVRGAPVFADQVTATLWPCADQVVVRHGIAEAPQWRLRTGDDLEGATEDNAFFVGNGGTLAGIDRTARFVELPSALDPPGGREMYDWGHVERVEYDHPPGLVDVSVGTERRWGWTRLPTLADKDYTGRDVLS